MDCESDSALAREAAAEPQQDCLDPQLEEGEEVEEE